MRCAPEGSRTPNLLIRSQVLYPIKLQVPFLTDCKNMLSFQTNIVFLKISQSIKNHALKVNQRIAFKLFKRFTNCIKIWQITCRFKNLWINNLMILIQNKSSSLSNTFQIEHKFIVICSICFWYLFVEIR